MVMCVYAWLQVPVNGHACLCQYAALSQWSCIPVPVWSVCLSVQLLAEVCYGLWQHPSKQQEATIIMNNN